MRSILRLGAMVALGVCGLVIRPASGMMLRPITLAELARQATTIVHGTVEDVSAGRDARGAPATWVTLAVKRAVKGGQGDRLTFKQFGSADPFPDGTIARIPGLPSYRVGDEVVLFLDAESSAGFTSPLGMGQGLYRVQRTQGGGRATVRRDLSPPTGASARTPAAPAVTDVDAFLDEVQRLAEGGAATAGE
jgi:hypothetical protein